MKFVLILNGETVGTFSDIDIANSACTFLNTYLGAGLIFSIETIKE